MGSDNGNADEKPVHNVYLDAFYIDKYKVTNALYKLCVDAQVCAAPKFNNSYIAPNLLRRFEIRSISRHRRDVGYGERRTANGAARVC